MKTVEFIKSSGPSGTTLNPHWSYRSVPAGAESGTYVLATEAVAEIAALREELETERMRLAACGVVAMANTIESAAKTRIPKDNPYYSASLGDVEAVVDREMALREQLSAEQTSVNELSLANQDLHERQRVLVETLRLAINKFDDEGYHCIAYTLKAALETSDA